MNRQLRILFLMASGCGVCLSPAAWSQDDVQNEKKLRSERTSFAPGVVRVVPPAAQAKEAFVGPLSQDHFLASYPEIQWNKPDFDDRTPHFDPRSRTLAERIRKIVLNRDIYCFEFAFKPLRHIFVDIPQPNGLMKRRLVWYMVYRIKYLGRELRPAADANISEPLYNRIKAVSFKSRQFIPMFVLIDRSTGKEYVDRCIPAVKRRIRVREKISGQLNNCVEISDVRIKRSTDTTSSGTWGLATWVGVDPNIDFFSVNVFGLTNALQRQRDDSGKEIYKRKALQLHFFRPGDTVQQTEDEIQFGIPAFADPEERKYILAKYGIEKPVDYRWLFP